MFAILYQEFLTQQLLLNWFFITEFFNQNKWSDRYISFGHFKRVGFNISLISKVLWLTGLMTNVERMTDVLFQTKFRNSQFSKKITEYPFKAVVAVLNYNARLSSIYIITLQLCLTLISQPYLIIAVIRKFCSKQVQRRHHTHVIHKFVVFRCGKFGYWLFSGPPAHQSMSPDYSVGLCTART